jgi:feruloyl esterase
MEAQRYPEDYDGIIAGAPAYDWTGIAADFIWNTRALRAADASIPISKVPALQAAVRKSCSGGDTFVNDPQACRFDPASLSCTNDDADSCLTRPQVSALRKLYAGPRTSKGEAIYPGFSPSGAELGVPPGNGWDGWMLAPPGGDSHQERYPREMLAYFTTTLKTDIDHFDFNRDYPPFKSELSPLLDATNANLRPFANRGGKLILWHGWADPGLPPLRTVEYFHRVRATMGAKNADTMMRLFMVPGVQHCLGGPGPNAFGQFAAPSRSENPREDLSLALERWVETGNAPEDVLARHTTNPFAPALDSTVAATDKAELICAYPKIATENHGSFECRAK